MTKPPQVSAKMRKYPKQSRSKITMEAILDAAVQLLDKGTANSISTNHIAERAGVSIGTLYQYFPNKTAVLLAVADRGRQSTAREVIDELAKVDAESLEETTRQIIRILIKTFSNSHRERQLSVLIMILKLEGHSYTPPMEDVAAIVAKIIGSVLAVQRPQSQIASFVLTRSVMGAIQAALFDAPNLIKEREFEDQLVRLAMGFFNAQ